MLGRLARWLRMLGADVLYYADISDANLLRIARSEDRAILTRDTHLCRKKTQLMVIQIHANDTIGQIREFVAFFPHGAAFGAVRCTACNGRLSAVHEPSSIRNAVPDHVLRQVSTFTRCSDCGRIYWEGSHLCRFREAMRSSGVLV